MRVSKQLTAGLFVVVALAGTARSHCEIPCGIYGDSARVAAMREHVTTIEKSMKQIVERSAAEVIDYNQLVRWVTNKEEHANQLQDIATQYFMFQRIKPADSTAQAAWKDYQAKLTLLHRLTVQAMKAKQSTDLAHVEKLRSLIGEFENVYFGE